MPRRGGSEALVRELLDLAGIELDGPGASDLRVNDGRFFDRVVRDRELGLGEAYQEGWWEAERVDELLAKVLAADLKGLISGSPRLMAFALATRLVNRQTLRRAAHNATAHYDIGNDLYERMLDKRMIYSCGYWDGVSDLDAAQEAKLELICRKLHLEHGMHLLDIGCGWGGLAQYAAERHGVRITGISPAAEQVSVATARCAGLDVEIKQLDFRQVAGRYDRIVSVGMLEHVGPKNYRAFFEANHRLLTDDGIALHHTIGSNRTQSHTDPWFDRHIFPGGVLPSMEHIGAATQGDWALEDVHNFGPDYDRTLMAWHHNIDAAWDDLPDYDERFRRTWRYYLLGSAASFRVRNLQLWQLVFTKARRYSGVYRAVR
ncbi:MAG: cyclopropane fatty acyl phospholipid synthase [Acidimicrobiales bacterium]